LPALPPYLTEKYNNEVRAKPFRIDYVTNFVTMEKNGMKRIQKIYQCDDCGMTAEFPTEQAARSAGWGFSRGRVKCWCPRCAEPHRHRWIGKNK
jgi:hypothetical protein